MAQCGKFGKGHVVKPAFRLFRNNLKSSRHRSIRTFNIEMSDFKMCTRYCSLSPHQISQFCGG